MAAGQPDPIKPFASGGVVDRETVARIGEGNLREAVIPLENGGAAIVARELVARMQSAPEWAMMTGGMQTPSGFRTPSGGRGLNDDIDLIFNAPVTINAQSREDATRSLHDVGWAVRAVKRSRGW